MRNRKCSSQRKVFVLGLRSKRASEFLVHKILNVIAVNIAETCASLDIATRSLSNNVGMWPAEKLPLAECSPFLL